MEDYTLPLSALKTQAMAKNPIPTAAKPHPATSSYLKAPSAISAQPTKIIIKVAQANTVFLFIIFLNFGVPLLRSSFLRASERPGFPLYPP